MVDGFIKFKGTLDDPEPIFTRKMVKKYFGWKPRENAVVLHYLAVDHFDFTRKIVQIFWAKKSWKLHFLADFLNFKVDHEFWRRWSSKV